jgi:hypothetical protein
MRIRLNSIILCELGRIGSEDRSGLVKEEISVRTEYLLTFLENIL